MEKKIVSLFFIIAFVAVGYFAVSPETPSRIIIVNETLRVNPLKPRENEIESGTDPSPVVASVAQEGFVFAETDGLLSLPIGA